ncbi:subtilisin-like protein [Epithele typhae]|uniref:subtilisin-like protein n=1 Tax=Epithele typhae TaxID=378194 RepID=UPI002008A4D0|nr:subtilisin-like protein [Epithele typhae]KAH9945437.1 subtilisin-like protein [Epithele typhae]
MLFKPAFTTICLALLASASPAPQGWSILRRADPNTLVPLRFSLAQRNLDRLDAFLLDVADPASPNYGKHWSPEKVASTFRPSQHAVDAVRTWLAVENGIARDRVAVTRHGGTVALLATVAEAERLLGADFHVYRRAAGGAERVGCHDAHRLPRHVAEHIDFVHPTVPTMAGTGGLSSSARSKRAPDSASGHLGTQLTTAADTNTTAECDESVSPDCIRELYDFNYTLVASDKNSAAVFGRQMEFFIDSDLDEWFALWAPEEVGARPNVISVQGGDNSPGDFGTAEAETDLEMMMSLLDTSLTVGIYQVKQTNDVQDPIDVFLAALDGSFCDVEGVKETNITDCGGAPRSNVVSISYSLNPDIQHPLITPVLERQCAEFGKLSLTGMTFLASSGDSGVAWGGASLNLGVFEQGCLASNGTLVDDDPPDSSFVGTFPASCPYITAVGGTAIPFGSSTQDPEVASLLFPSGGGFSNTFARPAWQDGAVAAYLDGRAAPAYPPGTFNRSGRAFPDVSANAGPTPSRDPSSVGQFIGTSVSAPLVAALVVAANDARLALDKGPVGFINPALYSPAFARAFHDVVSGANSGCGTDGFAAAPGWDPVTGLGTPDFPTLLAAFVALP